MSKESVENLVASYMECLGTIGVSLPDTLLELSQVITESLLKGGKLVILTDTESRHIATQLTYLLANGHNIERPVLPAIDFYQLAETSPHIESNTLLSHLLEPEDTLLGIARDHQQIQAHIKGLEAQAICLSNGIIDNNLMPYINIATSTRDQWFIALSFICNYLSLHIESSLFGSTE